MLFLFLCLFFQFSLLNFLFLCLLSFLLNYNSLSFHRFSSSLPFISLVFLIKFHFMKWGSFFLKNLIVYFLLSFILYYQITILNRIQHIIHPIGDLISNEPIFYVNACKPYFNADWKIYMRVKLVFKTFKFLLLSLLLFSCGRRRFFCL